MQVIKIRHQLIQDHNNVLEPFESVLLEHISYHVGSGQHADILIERKDGHIEILMWEEPFIHILYSNDDIKEAIDQINPKFEARKYIITNIK